MHGASVEAAGDLGRGRAPRRPRAGRDRRGRSSRPRGAPAAIHDVRRCLKRLRALLRLLRPALADASMPGSQAPRRYRPPAVGGTRPAGHARDARPARGSLWPAAQRHRRAQSKKLLANGGRRSKGGTPPPIAGRSHRATGARAQILHRQRHRQDRARPSGRGSRHAYRKARKAFRASYREPSDEAFHAWRKAVQLHWRHMLLLSRGWPEALARAPARPRSCRACWGRITTSRCSSASSARTFDRRIPSAAARRWPSCAGHGRRRSGRRHSRWASGCSPTVPAIFASGSRRTGTPRAACAPLRRTRSRRPRRSLPMLRLPRSRPAPVRDTAGLPYGEFHGRERDDRRQPHRCHEPGLPDAEA